MRFSCPLDVMIWRNRHNMYCTLGIHFENTQTSSMCNVRPTEPFLLIKMHTHTQHCESGWWLFSLSGLSCSLREYLIS